MARQRIFQPTTKTTNDLVIGLMRVALGATGTRASHNFDTATAYNAANVGSELATVGAVKSASLSMTPTFKEHKAGYPQVLDFKIAELLSAVYKFEIEEFGSGGLINGVRYNDNMAMLDDAIESLETGTPKFRAIEARAEFATGGNLSLFSNYAQLKPNLSLSFGDDFSAAPFEFEALANPDALWDKKDLVYRYRTDAAIRTRDNQPMTGSPDNLAIGMFQVRVGRPYSGHSSRGEKVWPCRRVNNLTVAGTRGAVTSSGDYDGSDGNYGAYVFKVTSTTGDAITMSIWYPETSPTGVADETGVTLTANSYSLASGVTITFGSQLAANNAVNDTYVIGVQAGTTFDTGVTGILSPYSFLTSADSVGAIQSASIATNPTYKDHFSGYPKVKDLSILESSTVTIDSALEEISAPSGTVSLVSGQATSIYDMIFDASKSGTLYNVPVEIVANLATGVTLSFWFPNCQIIPTGEFSPSNEWATMPFQLDAQVQNNMRRIYRQAFVQGI